MLINQQAPEKPTKNEHGFLEVHSVWPTLQGEGPFAGIPAVFIRLAGCNIQCTGCDTDYTSIRRHATPQDILADVQSLRKEGLVVITGGEPFRQAGLVELVYLLNANNYLVQIETNGTLYLEMPYIKALSIVCSPKTTHINKQMWYQLHALKYVVQAGHVDEEDGLPTMVLGVPCRVARPPDWWQQEIYIQPCDEQDPEKNKANMEEAVRVVMKHGYRLSVQAHKVANLP